MSLVQVDAVTWVMPSEVHGVVDRCDDSVDLLMAGGQIVTVRGEAFGVLSILDGLRVWEPQTMREAPPLVDPCPDAAPRERRGYR